MKFKCDRRRFLRDSALWIAAAPSLPAAASGAESGARVASNEADIELSELVRGFAEPPDSARPWVFWMVMDGNLSREGVTADLEAMQRVGIRGLVYMEVDQFVPKGPYRFMSPQWREMIQHALKEATRLGLTFNMNNDGGYCGSGGPWVTPEQSMQMLVWSERTFRGPARVQEILPQPKTVRDYYRDIAVLAFPRPAAEGARMADRSPQFSYGKERRDFDGAKLVDGHPDTVCLIPPAANGQSQYLNIDFPEPFTAQCLTVALDPWNSELSGTLEISEDGEHYQVVRPLKLHWPVSSVNFPSVTSRHYRISMIGPGEDVDWLFRVFEKGFPLGEVELHSSLRIEDIPGKAAYIRQEVFSGEPALMPEMLVRAGQILDLTNKMDQEGRLSWDVPAGKWTVLRIGHSSTGKMNHPAPEESLGLECDKLSKTAIEAHFAAFIQKLLDDQAAVGAKALMMTHVDSWETGSQNWTPGFREEFQKRRGYDLLPYLAVLTGRAVESREVSERFLWDLRRTVADLLVENYATHLREISHRHGLTLSIEGYGGGPFVDIDYGACADVPMAEFWTGKPFWWDLLMGWCKSMASAAHLHNRPILAAESFTSEPQAAKWQNHPYQLKPLGDLAFTLGINRLIFHRYALQPWLNRKPGMTFGAFGINHERTNTWWEQSRAWHAYLSRCQYLLQQGRFVADVAYLGSENAPYSFPKREQFEPVIPPGYDFDDLSPKILLEQGTVRDGRLECSSGMSYRLLVLPPGETMTPVLLEKIKELVVGGATVVGPRPSSSPSLTDYPRCDAEVQRLAEELWGRCDGVSLTENRVGKGKVVWGKPLAEVLASLNVPPDFACRDATVGEQIRYIHRNLDGVDIYFVASAVPQAKRFLCTFRAKGKRPELWWPDSGRIESVAVYDVRDEGVILPLDLDPCGSVFVIFREGDAPSRDRVVSLRINDVEVSGLARAPVPEIQLLHAPGKVVPKADGGGFLIEAAQSGKYEAKTAAGRQLKANVPALHSPIDVTGPWELEFPKGWGAPERVTLDRLISWTDHSNPGVKYFSGTATYRRRIEIPAVLLGRGRKLYLDLGRVEVMAEVKLNGHDLGILWKPPYRVEISEFAGVGQSDLEVRVVNLWPNRLIGDDHLPSDCEWIPAATGRNLTPHGWGAVLGRYPQWVLDNQPSPTGRVTFATWQHWTGNDPLFESGLLGPVTLQPALRVPLAGR